VGLLPREFSNGHMNSAYISGKVLAWARNSAGLDAGQLATREISADDILLWERGFGLPTEKQAKALAEKLGIPYAMLFMEDPPKGEPPKIPDLRTVSGKALEHPSREFLQVLDDSRIRQAWCRNERQETLFPRIHFVSSFVLKNDPIEVASDMRSVLNIDSDFRSVCKNYEEFQAAIVSKAEDAGVLVMRSSIVGHSTRRRLAVSEFRGFALTDPFAPMVFINDADAEAAQIFTLAHELVHIWIGKDGVSDQIPTEHVHSHNAIELFCDRVAAEVLVPEAEFLPRWLSSRTESENISLASKFFKVSSLVVLRRALELNKITLASFASASRAEYDGFRRRDTDKITKQKRAKKKGGNFWASFELRNGARFNATVVESVRRQRTTYTEASALFGVNLSSTAKYIRSAGVG
jgi:Zn-dependent peptidase ImmA (M78 family)